MYHFTFRPYTYPFPRPLQTHHGLWTERQGIIVQLQDGAGQSGRGEIAPVPWFGSESFAAALEFCQTLPARLTAMQIWAIPSNYPACQFGLESAWEQLQLRSHPQPQTPLSFCGLLPAGAAALDTWPHLWDQGYRTFKWKIGVQSADRELALFKRLIHQLPPSAKLRLDANGGLDLTTARIWLELCDRSTPLTLEYLEQPLPPDKFSALQRLMEQYRTPLALDESVATLAELQQCHQARWSGIYVIKPAIIGSPRRLRQFLQGRTLDLVFSTVFETEIGHDAGLGLAQELASPGRAVGYGLQPLFKT